MQERLATGQVDLLDAELFRLADGRQRPLRGERLEPWVARAGSVDAMRALEIAPGPGDLDPERGEAQERRDRSMARGRGVREYR